MLGNPIERRPIGSPRRRWEGNITIDLKQICVWTRNRIYLGQDRDYWRALGFSAPLQVEIWTIKEQVLLIKK
jgi:hypothetical protein